MVPNLIIIEGESIINNENERDIYFLNSIFAPTFDNVTQLVQHQNPLSFEQVCQRIQDLGFLPITIDVVTQIFPVRRMSGRGLARLLNYLVNQGYRLLSLPQEERNHILRLVR